MLKLAHHGSHIKQLYGNLFAVERCQGRDEHERKDSIIQRSKMELPDHKLMDMTKKYQGVLPTQECIEAAVGILLKNVHERPLKMID